MSGQKKYHGNLEELYYSISVALRQINLDVIAHHGFVSAHRGSQLAPKRRSDLKKPAIALQQYQRGLRREQARARVSCKEALPETSLHVLMAFHISIEALRRAQVSAWGALPKALLHIVKSFQISEKLYGELLFSCRTLQQEPQSSFELSLGYATNLFRGCSEVSAV